MVFLLMFCASAYQRTIQCGTLQQVFADRPACEFVRGWLSKEAGGLFGGTGLTSNCVGLPKERVK